MLRNGWFAAATVKQLRHIANVAEPPPRVFLEASPHEMPNIRREPVQIR
jgi:hypothetical protein